MNQEQGFEEQVAIVANYLQSVLDNLYLNGADEFVIAQALSNLSSKWDETAEATVRDVEFEEAFDEIVENYGDPE